MHLFPAIFHNPKKIRFIEQEEDERIILFLRQHPIVNVPWIVISLIALITPPILFQLDELFNVGLFVNIPASLIFGGLVIWYMLILAYAVENFLFWYFNIYIVTNKHIVDIDLESILNRRITETQLGDIESVAPTIAGIFGSLFNFGDVDIESAAKTQAINFRKVPRPDFVVDTIEDLSAVSPGP